MSVAVFRDSPGAFHHKCAFLSHARLMSGALISVCWVHISKIEFTWIIINGFDFDSLTSGTLWTFKADLNCVFAQPRGFCWSCNGSAEQLVFSHQRQAFCFKALGMEDGVCSGLDKCSLFGATFVQGEAVSFI